MSAAKPEQLPRDEVPEFAFAGRSNAGKSSALNVLCAQKGLARVSKTPGRTQLINLFEIEGLCRLIDLPGYGFADVPRELQREWGKSVGGYVESRLNLRALVVVMDIRHPMTDLDRQMLAWAEGRQLRAHILLTKADKLGFGAGKNQMLKVRRELPETTSVQTFSSLEKKGVDEVLDVLLGLLQPPPA